MARSCPSCTSDIQHCHGLLITHDGWTECTDAGCLVADPVLHDDRIECACCDVTLVDATVDLVA
jgi:hypothetical protein